MGIKNRIACLEGHHPGAEEIGPVVVHFVSPVEGEDYGKGYATFLGTGIPQICGMRAKPERNLKPAPTGFGPH